MSWTESDAAHKLIRRKNRKASRIARKSSIKSKAQKDAEGMEMTPDIMDYPGLPVVPDSYGTNSALESGQGVPQWYGSAESFEAMARHDPSGDDRDDVKAQFKMTYPGFTMSNSSLQYLIYQSGSSNKYHMFWLAQDKSGGWYAFSGYGRIGYAARMVRITGPTSQETAMRAMQSKINKKVGKGYTNVSRDFGMSAEESGKFMTFGEISYQYEYEDPSEGNLDEYDVQQIDRAVKNYISDDGGRDGEGVFTYTWSARGRRDMDISVSWTHKYSGATHDFASEYQDMMCCGEHMEYHESNKVNYFYCPICEESIKTNEFDAEASDEDWDRTEYEYKEVEIAKPFRTAFMASLGFVVAPLALLAGLAFAFGDE